MAQVEQKRSKLRTYSDLHENELRRRVELGRRITETVEEFLKLEPGLTVNEVAVACGSVAQAYNIDSRQVGMAALNERATQAAVAGSEIVECDGSACTQFTAVATANQCSGCQAVLCPACWAMHPECESTE